MDNREKLRKYTADYTNTKGIPKTSPLLDKKAEHKPAFLKNLKKNKEKNATEPNQLSQSHVKEDVNKTF